MSGLLENAVQSIQLGVEDYQAADAKRALSAVRNFYAGVLLLAKEVLVRAVPNANPEEVIGAQFKPIPDGSGKVTFKRKSHQTIDFNTIGDRFKDFNLRIDQAALRDLNRVRNDVEHHYTKKPRAAVREAIAKAMPVVANLFRSIKVAPNEALGEAWQVMLAVREFYEAELAACRSTLDRVEWPDGMPVERRLNCPECHSNLVAQQDPDNTSHETMDCRCRSCGHGFSGEKAIPWALKVGFEWESYIAFTDGGNQPVQDCPDCGLSSYLLTEQHVGCVWCGLILGECGRCRDGLTPENVSPENHDVCGYCANLLLKDD